MPLHQILLIIMRAKRASRARAAPARRGATEPTDGDMVVLHRLLAR